MASFENRRPRAEAQPASWSPR